MSPLATDLSAARWRNRQTRGTQNPVVCTHHEGSTPSLGTSLMRPLTAAVILALVAAVLIGAAGLLGYVENAAWRQTKFDELAEENQALKALLDSLNQEKEDLRKELGGLQKENALLKLRIEGLVYSRIIVKEEVEPSPEFAVYINDERLDYARLVPPRRVILQLYKWDSETNQHVPIGKRVDLAASFALKPGMVVTIRKLTPEELAQGRITEPFLLDSETGLWVEIE